VHGKKLGLVEVFGLSLNAFKAWLSFIKLIIFLFSLFFNEIVFLITLKLTFSFRVGFTL